LTSEAEAKIRMTSRLRLLRGAVFALCALAVFFAYRNTFKAPFVFDDLPAIRDNGSIRNMVTALHPPSADGNTVGGRPLLNLSFALNHAVHGLSVGGYHALNLAIHCVNGWLLFALVSWCLRASPVSAESPFGRRRTENPTAGAIGEQTAFAISLVVALLWLVHPLQTESVTYVVQRAESLSAFFILLTLYAFCRYSGDESFGERVESPDLAIASDAPHALGRAAPFHRRFWGGVAVLACSAGVATKETVAVAPILVLLCDRAFVTGTFTGALRKHWRLYLGLALSWMLAAWMIHLAGGRGGSVGFATEITPLDYAKTQPGAILRYLRLVFWPSGQVFDYGSPVVRSWSSAIPAAVAVVTLLGCAGYALRRWPRTGTPAAAFFVLLAPSSSFIPVATQTVAEHRVYLALGCIVVLVTLGVARWLSARAVWALALLAIPLAVATEKRNETYRTARALWADTVANRPSNPRAHNNLGLLLAEEKRFDEAVTHFEEAVRLFPENPDALSNLGQVYLTVGKLAEAVAVLEPASKMRTASVQVRVNLAEALARSGRPAEAVAEYDALAQAGVPLDVEALATWGGALLQLNQAEAAVVKLRAALALNPGHARTHYNLGNAYARAGQWREAVEEYRAAIASSPDYLAAQANLGNALLLSGRPDEAVGAYEAALRLKPDDRKLQANLERARARAVKK
jgi:protein O-mannosyl-transferase